MSFLTDLREGHANGYPWCCVIRFSLERALRYDAPQSLERGVRQATIDNPHVPCFVFHRAEFTYAEHVDWLNRDAA
jgi:hypothetical protein